MESVNVRNLDDIQEEERGSRGTRLFSLLFASLAGAAIVTAGVIVSRKGDETAKDTRDPLADLVAQAKGAAPSSDKLETRDVSFPGILSDHEKPTTALAAVKDERGRLLAQSTTADEPPPPPPASDRLPVVPLPVGDLLSATPVTTAPKDGLTALAADASKLPGSTELAPAGMDGGFQLQVASFKDQPDADRLVGDLRRRGHRAYRLVAQVPAVSYTHLTLPTILRV